MIFCNINPSKTRTVPQMLTPFIGIMTNLNKKITEADPKYDSIEQLT